MWFLLLFLFVCRDDVWCFCVSVLVFVLCRFLCRCLWLCFVDMVFGMVGLDLSVFSVAVEDVFMYS